VKGQRATQFAPAFFSVTIVLDNADNVRLAAQIIDEGLRETHC
jgi:hypothetical protein